MYSSLIQVAQDHYRKQKIQINKKFEIIWFSNTWYPAPNSSDALYTLNRHCHQCHYRIGDMLQPDFLVSPAHFSFQKNMAKYHDC